MKDNTGLYYAVDNAISKLQAANLPNDLVNVSIVTFTDGLDNVSTMLNTNYTGRDKEIYRNDVKGRIDNTKIKNVKIDSYMLGLPGNDVQTGAYPEFNANLSAFGKVVPVTNMDEVYYEFGAIADSLKKVSTSQSIQIKMPGGYNSGTKMRFTFDNVTDAAMSNLYIEGTYNIIGSSFSLQNVDYEGLKSSSGKTVNGVRSGAVDIIFTFENVSTNAGGSVTTTNTKHWYISSSSSQWQPNSEFGKTGDVTTTVTQKSAVIMLVLDCTTSLGTTMFSGMKSAAINFIDVLLGKGNTPNPSIGVLINGVRWATSNVDNPGTFAANPEDAGKFYQWNRRTAWATTGSVSGWDSSTPPGTSWTKANDPCPSGWRVPTQAEQKKLVDAGNTWIIQNGVSGRRFGSGSNTIFLPAVGLRYYDGVLLNDDAGHYWNSEGNPHLGFDLFFDKNSAQFSNGYLSYGECVRCVAE